MSFTSSSSTGPQKTLRPSNRPPHTTPLVTPEEPLGAGDSRIVYNLLPPEVVGNAYGKLVKEVEWIRMVHRGMWPFQLDIPCSATHSDWTTGGEVPRLVAQQGEIVDQDGR